MFFSSSKVIGLDIGSSSIKLADLTTTKKGVELNNFAFIPTPTAAITNGEITDSILVAETVKSAYKENSFKTKNTCVGLPGSAVILKKISIPKTDPKNLRDQVQYEAAQYLPFDLNQVTIDFHQLSFSQSVENMDILVAAAQNEFILTYLESLHLAGLKCSILDVSSLALANIFEVNYGKTTEPVALFNFGSGVTNFIVLLQGEVIFSRDIPVGGFQFTNEISKNMSITFEEAESLKISMSQQGEVPEETRGYMNMALEHVTEEIRNSIDFYTANANGLMISKAYYTGGASLTQGLVEHLADSTKLEFEVFNPLLKVTPTNKKLTQAYLQQISPFIAVACGLGIRQAGKK